MVKMNKSILVLVGVLLFNAHHGFSQDSKETKSSIGIYDPSPEYPFGRLNPKAPPQTKQFAFMIGEFDTREEIRNQDGTWRKSTATWNGAYFLNGFGIRDYYWNEKEGFATANIRIFNFSEKKWYITFFRGPGNGNPGQPWIGEWKGDKMVIWRGDEKQGTRLMFYDISENGYSWIGENFQDGVATAFWKEFATRRKTTVWADKKLP